VGGEPKRATKAVIGEPSLLVGRDHELARLLELYEAASVGRRQLALITGVAGIGKTALARELVRVLASPGAGAPRIGEGHCLRRYALLEPYAPLLTALGEVTADCTADDPIWNECSTWLAQMSTLLSPEQQERLRQSLLGTGTARMLREGIALAERLSEQQPLVLLLEDIHRCDRPTLEWLSSVVARTTPARLLIVATLRLSRARSRGFVSTMVARLAELTDRVTSLSLEALPADAARDYVHQRLEGEIPAAQRAAIADASQGYPLFLEALVDDVAGGKAVPQQLPATLRELLARWLDELTKEDLELLEAAATAGTHFSAREVAAALDRDPAAVGGDCERLAEQRRLLLRHAVTDGERDTYAFRHLLFGQSLVEHMPSPRRRRYHLLLGQFLERRPSGDPRTLISRLVWHFEAGGDLERHAYYLERAAEQLAARFAYREAADVVERCLAAIHRLPDTPQNALREAARQLDYGNLVVALWGFGDARAARAFDRAFEQARRHGDELLMFRAQLGRCLSGVVAGDVTAREPASALLEIVARGHVELSSVAHLYNSYVEFIAGRFAQATEHAVRAERDLAQALPGVPVLTDLESFLHVALALALTPRGELADASAHRERALVRLASHGFPYQRATDLAVLATSTLAAGDADATLALAEQSMEEAERFGLHAATMLAACCRAWARCRRGEGTLEALESAVEERARAREMWFESLLFVALAELCVQGGDLERAAYWLKRAGRVVGESAFEAERWRVRALLARELSARGRSLHEDAAFGDCEPGSEKRLSDQDCFAQALRIARAQGARLFEERTARSMAHDRRS